MRRATLFNVVFTVIASLSIAEIPLSSASESTAFTPGLSNVSSESTQISNTTKNIKMSVCGIDISSVPFFSYSSAETPPSGVQSGIAYDVIKEVTQRVDVDIELIRYPWKRCLAMLKKGTVDGVMGASFVEERRLFGHYPTTPEGLVDNKRLMYSSVYWLYTNSQSITWDGTSINMPGDGVAATILGYSSVNLLRKLGVEAFEEYLPSTLVTMLASNRPVLVASYATQLEALIIESVERGDIPSDLIEKMPIPLSNDEMYLLISKPFYRSHKSVAESIWDSFRKLHESGRYDEIANAYTNQ